MMGEVGFENFSIEDFESFRKMRGKWEKLGLFCQIG